MDGATTVVSIAAAEAVRRGMIVVNAMGNEDSRTEGTITAPADVDGVVSVGSVTQSRMISGFSSTGPTYDGRMKPEVVAPGSVIPVPDTYPQDTSAYTVVNGTSFSAPLVSAIMALILQANPDISAQAAKERLYASCDFAPGQNAPNNRFGYGIPNAALALMDKDEIFLKVTDIDKKALAGAAVEFGGQSYTADAYGDVLIKTQKSALPAQLRISYRDRRLTDTLTVDALPFARVVEIDGKWNDGLKVTPNIVRKNGVVKGRYTFAGADAKTPTVATVRTLAGKRVWSQRLRLHPDGSADFVWDARGKGGAAAGVYIVVVRHGYSVVSERVVVSN
jgi:subtilisin family serine protease